MDKILNLEQTEMRELELLFRNIQQGLRRYSLAELNENIGSLVNGSTEKLRDKQRHINIIIDIICTDFKLQRSTFLKGRGKGKVQEARKYAYCILHEDLNLPIRYIAKSIFSLKWHTSVSVVLKYHKTLREDLKPDRLFMEKLNHLREAIANRLNNDII